MKLLRFDIRNVSRNLFIGIALFFVANVVFYVLIARGTVREYDRLRLESGPRFDRLEARRLEVERQEAFLAALTKAEADLSKLREEVLSTRERRLVEVQLEVADIADRFSVPMESVASANEVLSDERIDRLEMVVPLEGGYANLRRFLQAVEDSTEFLVVENVRLGEAQDGGSLLLLNITLATYFDVPDRVAVAETQAPTADAAAKGAG